MDTFEYCRKCAKKTRHKVCRSCNGRGKPLGGTKCYMCDGTGRKCENGVNDRFHR
jgi:hypothetical protein